MVRERILDRRAASTLDGGGPVGPQARGQADQDEGHPAAEPVAQPAHEDVLVGRGQHPPGDLAPFGGAAAG